jgi:hypothetical protein
MLGDRFRLSVVDGCDIGEKPVASSSDGLDEAGILGRIAYGVSNLADRLVQAVIEVNGRPRPQPDTQFLSGHQFSRLFQEHDQQSEWLLLQPDALAVFGQPAKPKIGFEYSKPKP